jgi:hypothetical protein
MIKEVIRINESARLINAFIKTGKAPHGETLILSGFF